MSYDAEFQRVVLIEGGYSDNPLDSGGKTKYGITEAEARAYGYVGEMRDLSLPVARGIYRERFWDYLKLDEVERIAGARIAAEMFDTSVNCGPAVSVKFLQRALNVFNRQATLYPEIAVDGGVGRMTLAALAAYMRTHARFGADAELVLLRALDGQQRAFYLDLAASRQKDEEFVFGWFRARTA